MTVGQRVNKREDLAPIINGTLSRPDDTVAISPSVSADRSRASTRSRYRWRATEVRPDALSIPRAGLYPVTIAMQRDGRIMSTVLTFINRLPAADEATADAELLSVAVAIGTHSASPPRQQGHDKRRQRIDRLPR